jgi:hypothetical protein
MATILTPFDTAEPGTKPGGNGSHPQKAAPVLTSAQIPGPAGHAPAEPEAARLWTITPDTARELMAAHDHVVEQNHLSGAKRDGRNRKIRWDKVETYARDMKTGNWRGRNGQTIKIAWDGTVPDGQHRFMACIKAETPFETYVVFGVDPEDQDTMDTGIPRKIHDQLHMRGEVNANNLAAISRWAWKWLRGSRYRNGTGGPKPSELELIEFIDSDERLRGATVWAVQAYQGFRLVRVSVYGMAWLLFHGSDHLAAEVFLNGVVTGADLSPGHPALAFRNRMISAKSEQQRLSEHEQLGYLIMAWNAFKDDRTLAKLLPPRGGFSPKTFPEPK